MTVESFRSLAAEIMRRPARMGGPRLHGAQLGGPRLVAVDGPSGVGKTAFTRRLARALREDGIEAPVIHTDDLLDGWADQVTFWPRLEKWVLAPLRFGRAGAYLRYDWHTGRFGQQWTSVPPAPVVLLEGVTAARAAIRPELSLSVFLTAPAQLCLRRAVERDGEAVRPLLEEWFLGQRRHFAEDATMVHADLVVDGVPAVPHDEETQFVRLPRAEPARAPRAQVPPAWAWTCADG